MKNSALFLLVGSLCLFSAESVSAKERTYTNAEIQMLAKRVKAKKDSWKKRIKASSTPIVRFFLSSTSPKQGDVLTLFAQMDTSFIDQETIVLGQFDSAPVVLEHPAKELWIAELGELTEIRSL